MITGPQVQEATESGRALPFLKWAGGKRQLLSEIDRLLPPERKVYYEPFLGGGALFFHLDPPGSVLGDRNGELINAFEVVRDDTENLITLLKRHGHRHNCEYYYRLRARNPARLTPLQRAARLIYLNKTCYNGLYRVNSRGEFNVPCGAYRNPRICDANNLRMVQRRLQSASLLCADYQEIVENAGPGDFVYFDPPYHPLARSGGFVSYVESGFDLEEQKRLASTFSELTDRGVSCMLSNSAAPEILELYANFHIHRVRALRAINSIGAGRGKIDEIIVTNYA